MVNGGVTLHESVRVSGPARKNKATIAISAIDIAPVVYFQPDPRMAKGCPAGNIACTVAGNTTGLDCNGFRLVDHCRAISNRDRAVQPDQK